MPPRLTASNLSAAANIKHGFYGRQGGVSVGAFASLNCGAFAGDAAEAVATNRHRVLHDLGATELFCNRQVHGNRVRVVDGDSDADEVIRADGLVTQTPGIALGILTADCAPVLFADSPGGVIGAAHAGWQGALCGIADAVVAAMVELGACRGRIIGAIGPAIGRSSYRVGAEFFARFAAESKAECAEFFVAEADGYYFDLRGYVQNRLAGVGVSALQNLAVDTYADDARFFSYRRSCHRGEGQYGRQISAIALRGR